AGKATGMGARVERGRHQGAGRHGAAGGALRAWGGHAGGACGSGRHRQGERPVPGPTGNAGDAHTDGGGGSGAI
ncbi:hypothetical protein CYMTET_25494, partial [Cymbomonas tetramitiformis]